MASKQDKQLQEITKKLEQGVKDMLTSENYTEYLKVMSQFHDYSFNNTLLIAMQRPEATLVAGYHAWQKKFERHVKKGEKGIQIIAPAPIREKEEVEKIDPVTNEPILKENGQPETEIITHVIPRFRVTTVFDVSQTDGKPLPEFGIEDLTASVENYEAFMQAITSVSPVPIRYDEIEGESHGYYHLVDKEIVIQSGMSESQTMKTAIHEVSHAKLHDREIMEELGIQKDKLTREVEAESIAYCVCQYFGLDTSEYSFPYIGSWSSGKDMRELRSSMDTIRKTAGEFIDSMTAQLQEILRDGPEIDEIRMDDVVLRISGSMGSDYEYCVVKNMTVGQLEEAVRSYDRLIAEDAFVENDVSLEEYLEERGAKVTAIYASNGLGEDHPVDFFDVEYDVDTGITVMGELGAQRQAEMLIAKAEYNKTVFTDAQRNLITNYAYKFDNVEKARFLMEAIMQAHEETDSRAIFTVMQAAQEEIDSLPDSMVGLSEMHQAGYQRDNMLPVTKKRAHELFQEGYEIFALYLDNTTAELEDEAEIDAYEGLLGVDRETWERYHSMEKEQGESEKEPEPDRTNEDLLLNGEDNYYGIYQIDHDGEGAKYSFMNMAELNRNGVAAERSNYNLVYVGRLEKTDTLDSLYEKFNIHHPADFTGHSLSVSDVVLLHQAGENRAYFVDSFGFTEVPGFFLEKEWELDVAEENREMVFKVSDRMIDVRMERDGFDFQIYDEHYNMVEKGHYDDPALPMEDVALDVVRDRSGSIFDRDTHKSYRPYAWGHMHLDDELVEVDREGFHNELDAANARVDAAAVTDRTFQLEVEGHLGTWHTVEAREIMDKMFYRMEHDTYGDSVAGILVNADGKLVAQDLEHGFDRGAMEAIKEYFTDQGIDWEPEAQEDVMQVSGALEERQYPPVYLNSAIVAVEQGKSEEYRASWKLNVACKAAVEEAIRNNFDGLYLAHDVVKPVLEEYGQERLTYVLVSTLRQNKEDGRFSRANKEWAENCEFDGNRNIVLNPDFSVNSHPAVLDGFIGLARKEFEELEKAVGQDKEEPFIARYYAVNDVYGTKAESKYQYFDDLDEAITAYHLLPNHFDKQIGMENTEQPPSRMPLISCKNGLEALTDIETSSLSGKWVKPEVMEAQRKAEIYLDNRDTEIAFRFKGEKYYFFIQTSSEGGYDYTFYDRDFQEVDGGVYDNPDISIQEAMEEILSEEKGLSLSNCEVIDCDDFLEKVDRAEYFPQKSYEALKELMNSDADEVAFRCGYGYVSIQKVPEGYEYIDYDYKWQEVGGNIYDDPDASMEDVVTWIFKDEGFGILDCAPIDYEEVVKGTLQSAKERLTEDKLTPTSQISRREAALGGNSQHDIEETVLCYAQSELEEMGLADDVKLIAARIYGSRLREGLYTEKSDIDVVLSYSGDIREDDFFSMLHEHGMEIGGLPVDINPISTEKTGSLEAYMEQAEKYLDQKEVEKLAVDIDTFAYDNDFYEYQDRVEDREQAVQEVQHDLVHGKTDSLKSWLQVFVDEGEPEEIVSAAQGLIDRLDEAEKRNILHQAEQPEPSISFYVAECMEYPVMGEYHENLTLQEAYELYESIPAERINGVKGIGFCLEDGSIYNGLFTLMSGGTVIKDVINEIPHYRESPLVQKAIADMEAILSGQDRQKAVEPEKDAGRATEQAVAEDGGQKKEKGFREEKTDETIPKADTQVKEAGSGRKESVLKALRERQDKLKAQEKQPTEQSQARKKGEQEL